MHNRLHRGPAHRHRYNMKRALSHAIKSGHRQISKLVTGWKKVRKIKTWVAGWTTTLIQPPTTAPLCSAASVATVSVPTHTRLRLFLPSSLPLVWGNGKYNGNYSIQDIYMPLLTNRHRVARLWPAAPLPFTSFAESCCAHVGLEPTFPPPSTLAVMEDAQSSKDFNLTLDRGDHFLNTFGTPWGEARGKRITEK